jgi:glycosyltransferase involved in cell wall biosynthesis
MPVWQPQRAWLLEAVHSALAQRGCDLELIVVDDGNEMPVTELLAAVTDERVRHIRIAHGGVSAARNAGTAVAAGSFLRYIDADDVLDLDSTARLLDLAQTGGIPYEDTVVCDEQLNPQRRISSRLAGDIAMACLLGEFDARHVSMLFPREVVQRAGPWDTRLRVRQDFDFVLRCLEHAPAVPGEGTATYYRRHRASTTYSRHAVRDAQRSTRIIVGGYFARHPELRGTAEERYAWRRVHVAEADTALGADQPLRTLVKAAPLVRLDPLEALAFAYRAGRCSARLSRAAIARTTAPAQERLRRRAS